MKRKHIAVLFFLVSLLTASCSKMETLFTNGDPITEQRSVGQHFEVIRMYNNVNVKLVQSSHPHLELTCPENLIDKVITEIEGDTLTIRNDNDHNWLRSYDYSIDLTVYYDSLSRIEYASIGKLLCTDSIRGVVETHIDSTEMGIDTVRTKSFYLHISEGCGDIDLTFKCDVLKTNFSNGTSRVDLRGVSGYTEITVRSYGVVHAETLESNFARVQSESTNDTYVWARAGLRAWLYSIGNVYYKGNPWVVKECTNDGQVIKME